MNHLKLEKRITAELAGIKKLAASLPKGKANALLNKCAKIGAYARKGQALIEASAGRFRTSGCPGCCVTRQSRGRAAEATSVTGLSRRRTRYE